MKNTGSPARRRLPSGGAVTAWISAATLAAACSAGAPDAPLGVTPSADRGDDGQGDGHRVHHPPRDLDVSRSLEVTDLATLEATDEHGRPRFTLKRVLTRIAETSGADRIPDAREMYDRIFDTNNAKATSYVSDGQHCDDVMDGSQAMMNGFPIQCPRQEGQLASPYHDPFCSGPPAIPLMPLPAGSTVCNPYTPIAMVNRFDLAPTSGENCGQHRIVFAKGNQQSPLETAGNPNVFDRNLIIFEAIIPNPSQQEGIRGCLPLIQRWAQLSQIDDPGERAEVLDEIFFKGVQGFEPAVTFDHYTGAVDPATRTQTSGQIRCNQFMFLPEIAGELSGEAWQLKEYNTALACTGKGRRRSCGARINMATVKVNPYATLFDETNRSPLALRFRDPTEETGFFSQIPGLIAGNLNMINMSGLDLIYNGAQSTSSPALNFVDRAPDPQNDTNYNVVFAGNKSRDPGSFYDNIKKALAALNSPLTPTQLVRRAQTQACAGCHELATSTAGLFDTLSDASNPPVPPVANQLGPDGPNALVWPDDATETIPGVGSARVFTQTSEVILQPLPSAPSGTTCDTACTAHPTTCPCAWGLSHALTDVFLPFRKETMATFLDSDGWTCGYGQGYGTE